jgi:hypothetical protein
LGFCPFLINTLIVSWLESDKVFSEDESDDEDDDNDMLTICGCGSGRIIDKGLVTSMVGLGGCIC